MGKLDKDEELQPEDSRLKPCGHVKYRREFLGTGLAAYAQCSVAWVETEGRERVALLMFINDSVED